MSESGRKPVFHSVSDKIVKSNEDAAAKVVASNQIAADKIVESGIEQHQEHEEIAKSRFETQKKWNWFGILINGTILIILSCFVIAFFRYAIVVTTR